jgi:hypothetical protein
MLCWWAPAIVREAGPRESGAIFNATVLDAEAVVGALLALGRIAEDLADVVQSIDINPFVVLPRGGLALDALFVAHAGGEATGDKR